MLRACVRDSRRAVGRFLGVAAPLFVFLSACDGLDVTHATGLPSVDAGPSSGTEPAPSVPSPSALSDVADAATAETPKDDSTPASQTGETPPVVPIVPVVPPVADESPPSDSTPDAG